MRNLLQCAMVLLFVGNFYAAETVSQPTMDEFMKQFSKEDQEMVKEWKDKAGDDLVKELQQHVKKETAPYKYPRIVEFVDELPKTISGKIRRVEIRNKDSQK